MASVFGTTKVQVLLWPAESFVTAPMTISPHKGSLFRSQTVPTG